MSDLLKAAAWTKLVNASDEHANIRSKGAAQALSDAAKQWAEASGAPAPRPAASGAMKGTNGNTLRSGQVVPFGRTKGTPIEEAETKDLQWLAGAMRESIADPSKERFAPKNRELLDAIEHELETR
jgi:hypothetical protein